MKGALTNKKIILFLVAVIFLLIPVLFPSRFLIHLLTITMVMAIGALSMELIMGYTGQCSLAQGALFGIGAYTYSIAVFKLNSNVWLALFISPWVAALTGFFIGILCLRTRGSYFAIGTLAFNVLIMILVDHWDHVTGGAMGLSGIKGIPQSMSFWRKLPSFSADHVSYYLIFLFLCGTLFFCYRLIKSLLGRSMITVRESEEFAEAVGIHTMAVKVFSFTISAFIAGIGGALYVSTLGFVGPEAVHYHVGFDFLSFMIVGGMGTIVGPLIGTFILQALPTLLQTLPEYRLLIFGLLLIGMIIYLPSGVLGGLRTVLAKRNQ
jgi:branched-chain amino acid transport system permease protein